VAREPIEKFMSGGNYDKGTDKKVWADQVAADLSSSNPPHQLWRGKYAFEARIAGLLPTGWLDGTVASMVGIDVLNKRLAEMEKAK
jgi:1-acylglycerone phosphate reductase